MSEPIALPAARLVVDMRDGWVQLLMLNTHDDAYGDHWLAWSVSADEADQIAEAIKSQAERSREFSRTSP